MPIRVVMFDIGGILEVIPEGGDPATRFPALDEEWNARLGLPPGHLTTPAPARSRPSAAMSATRPW